ncbi:hypothetical protein NAV33_07180 [Pseudomonas stutzeri]|uniref:hypothetical protein n=1 Tax=Stutzerimonas stutzeri TaxID=316 RepID=UPI00210E374A|nr:hypothetical protein [Stutzerimonas stutzeri]MCQ4311676.1 hypothetical protein [Stutzerimonas stutzeri]
MTELNAAEREDAAEFMAATKGVPAYRVAYALNGLTPGTDWRGCSKSHMAEEWATRDRAFGRSSLRPVTIARLAAAAAKVQARYA